MLDTMPSSEFNRRLKISNVTDTILVRERVGANGSTLVILRAVLSGLCPKTKKFQTFTVSDNGNLIGQDGTEYYVPGKIPEELRDAKFKNIKLANGLKIKKVVRLKRVSELPVLKPLKIGFGENSTRALVRHNADDVFSVYGSHLTR